MDINHDADCVKNKNFFKNGRKLFISCQSLNLCYPILFICFAFYPCGPKLFDSHRGKIIWSVFL